MTLVVLALLVATAARQVADSKQIAADTEASLRKQVLKVERRETGCERGETDRLLATDASGHPRKYVRSLGSEDSTQQHTLYYDGAGRLRLVVITGGAVNGARLDHRIYLDASGQRLREDHRATRPGYTWPHEWPEEDLIRDPARAFAAPPGCN